jgi:hypothetical protein
MGEDEYLETFDRVNLCPSRWSARFARDHAADLLAGGMPLVLLGAKVSRAFGAGFAPFTCWSPPDVAADAPPRAVVIPHPSGLSRAWGDPASYLRAYAAVNSALAAWRAA